MSFRAEILVTFISHSGLVVRECQCCRLECLHVDLAAGSEELAKF